MCVNMLNQRAPKPYIRMGTSIGFDMRVIQVYIKIWKVCIIQTSPAIVSTLAAIAPTASGTGLIGVVAGEVADSTGEAACSRDIYLTINSTTMTLSYKDKMKG